MQTKKHKLTESQRSCRHTAHSICNLKFNVPNEILVVFHNGSNYDYHFIIKELANQFEGQFGCLGKNKRKLQKSIKMVTKVLSIYPTK